MTDNKVVRYKNTKWFKFTRKAAYVIARNKELPPEMRLWFLALDRLGPGGHANFGGEEISAILNVSDRAVNRYLKKLRESGLISSESSKLCVVVPIDVMDNSAQDGRSCPVHGHSMSVENGSSWFDPWAFVSDPDSSTRRIVEDIRTRRETGHDLSA